jgi:hypothetical protein
MTSRQRWRNKRGAPDSCYRTLQLDDALDIDTNQNLSEQRRGWRVVETNVSVQLLLRLPCGSHTLQGLKMGTALGRLHVDDKRPKYFLRQFCTRTATFTA